MIARVLYRKNVQGVLKYVLDKSESTILGFQNTYSDSDTDLKFFGRVLYHLGNRHDSEKRYAHISLNLPHGERLNDKDFFELAKDYMEQMGYGEQPYIVVRHHDTKHEHVHIVSTTIKEDNLQINLSNDIRRSISTQKYLEKEFGLSPSPETKQNKELPVYEMPELQKDDSKGVRFYMQDIVNRMLQKYKVRSFKELSELLKPYHIELRTVNRNDRIGVSYGVAKDGGYRSRFINGYNVHPQLSGPKLQKVFDANRQSKLLPMVKKRLEKQLQTTYGLFRTIHPEHLPDILKSHHNLDCRLDYVKNGKTTDFTIYDKSGYVLKSEEIAREIGILQNPEKFKTEYTQMNGESEQLKLELQRCIKEAYKDNYQNSGRQLLFSEHIDRIRIKPIVTEMAKSKRFLFLKKYLHTDNRKLANLVQSQFEKIKEELHIKESLKEEQQLQTKKELIKNAISKQLFDTPLQKEVLFELFYGLGTKYINGSLSYAQSHRHKTQLDFGHVPLPDKIDFHASSHFVRENEKMLDGLLYTKTEKEIGPGSTAIFLPLMFPNVYANMAPPYRERFERLSLKAYHKHAERMQLSFEKSPKDYIDFFNAKGFYFTKRQEKLHVHSIYFKYPVSVPLPPKAQIYLESSGNLQMMLDNQATILSDIENDGRDNLKSLWAADLMESGQYKKAAYLFVLDGVRPNLPVEIMQHHMEKGFRVALVSVSKKRIDSRQARLLRNCIYAIGNLVGSKTLKGEEVFNGFKDELTDWSKYRRKGMGPSL